MTERSLLVMTPVRDKPTLEYMASIIALQESFRDLGIRLGLHMAHAQSLPGVRNALIAQFLASDFDDALLVDDDVGFEPEMAWRLHVSQKPIIGGVHRKRTNEFALSDPRAWAFHPLGAGVVEPNAVEVAYTSSGFLKVSREALNLMIEKRPDLHRPNCLTLEGKARNHYHRLFWFGPHDDGEDVMFCRLWRSLGEKVWIDPGITLSHMGMTNFTGNVTECLAQKREAAE